MKKIFYTAALLASMLYSHLYAVTQDEFLAITAKYQKELVYENAIRSNSNDIRIRKLLRKRTDEYNSLNFNGYVQNWKGTITSISTMKDDVYVTIEIAPKVLLKIDTSMRNPLSDVLAEMNTDEQVIFSGSLKPDPQGCGFAEMSITTKGSLEEPEFKFILESIQSTK